MNNTHRPLVSVVIPSFNEEPHIVRASLESIRAQTFANFECIVVDESTSSELSEACRTVCTEDPRFVYVHPTERLGLAKCLNLAISQARGQFIARFDSDDLCMPDRLELQVAFLQAHPAISIVGGALDIISNEGRVIAHRHYPQTSTAIAKGMHLTTSIAHPTVMFRKEAIEWHGGYNSKFHFAEDLDLWLRWMNAGLLFANLPQVLVHYRQDSTRRDQRHWSFNLRARTSNFSGQYLVRRAIGISCIAIWVAVPKMIQELVYNLVILRRRRHELFQ
jgi:glycosyltransferase involved in cell wall biosynthesis